MPRATLVETARAAGRRGVGAQPDEVDVDLGRHRGRTISRFSASPSITASAAGTSSRPAPNTKRCSIRAASSSGAAGASPTWRRTASGVLDPAQVAAALRAGHGAGVHHARQQRDRRHPGHRARSRAICAQQGGARLHVDAAQSVGKCALDFARARRRPHVAVGAQGLRTEGRRALAGLAPRRRGRASHAAAYSAADRSGRCARAPSRRTKWWAWGGVRAARAAALEPGARAHGAH